MMLELTTSPQFSHTMEFIFSYQILFTLFLFLLIMMVLKIANLLSKNDNNLLSNLPPGPRKLPVIGNMHQMIGSLPHHTLRNLAKNYGPLMHLQLGELYFIVVSSADIAKEVMKTHDIVFSSRPLYITARAITYDYRNISLAPYGEYWRRLRKICTVELLTMKRVQSFRPQRKEEVSNLIKYISTHSGSPVNLSENILSASYGIISRAAFGTNCVGHEEFISLAKELLHLSSTFSIHELFPSIKLLTLISGVMRKVKKIHLKADRILENIILEHKAKKVARENSDGHEVLLDEEDLVDVLLRTQEDGDPDFPFTLNDMKAVILDMFVAGIETSAVVIEWAMSELLKNPRVMKRAQAEVRKAFNKKGYVDEADFDKLRYLKLIIKETMRLHPPAPLLIPRESRERCQIKGYEIPMKAQVIVNAWAIGRDPECWTDAETFIPERFHDSLIDYKGNNFEFIPFGAGRRMCPGINFGLANVEIQLASLLYHFDWKLTDGQELEDLDMTEAIGTTVKRKINLYVIPFSYYP